MGSLKYHGVICNGLGVRTQGLTLVSHVFFTFIDSKDDQLHMALTPSSSSYEDSTKLADDSSGSVSVSDAATSTIVVPINSEVG